MKYSTLIAAIFLGAFCAQRSEAKSALLPLRYETNGVSIHQGTSTQVIETLFGTNRMGLAFTGSNTYDFYSAPLATAIAFANSDKIGGVIYMANSAPTSANDFSVFGSMRYFDYDPATGVDTLVAEARQSSAAPQTVNHGKIARWNLVQSASHVTFKIPAGHLVHVAVQIVLNSGDPGKFGQLLFNGPRGSSTTALFPKTLTPPLNWVVPAVIPVPPSFVSITVAPDGTVQLNAIGDPQQTYLIQATTNLGDTSSWTTIGSVLSEIDGSLTFTDNDAPNYSYRFYRLSTP